jgi:hypothetical protein
MDGSGIPSDGSSQSKTLVMPGGFLAFDETLRMSSEIEYARADFS